MRLHEEKIALIELLLAQPSRTAPLSLEEIRAALPELAKSGHLADVKGDLMVPSKHHGYVLSGCYVECDGRTRLGYRLVDRDEAVELVEHLRTLPELMRRRGRPSNLATI